MTDLVASPELCLRARRDPEEALANYQLSGREFRRLSSVVHQRGMSVSCTLYRMNRLTPIYTLLPLTCRLLSDRLIGIAERFWSQHGAVMQFQSEVEAFGSYLLAMEDGESARHDEYLREVLEFDLAVVRLRFRRQESEPATVTVHFRHDPVALLGALMSSEVPGNVPEIDTTAILTLHGEDVEISLSPVQGLTSTGRSTPRSPATTAARQRWGAR